MFHKFLKVPKFGPFPGRNTTDTVKQTDVRHHKLEERSPSVVRIVRAGAIVEVYFMAIPAYKIMETYPSHFVTRPEVFRRPWDAVVKPDEILALGRKYYVVPRRTVKKLQQRILKPNIVSHNDSNNRTMKSYVSRLSNDSEKESYVKSYVNSINANDMSGEFSDGHWKMGTKKRVALRRGLPDTEKSYEDEDGSVKGCKPGDHVKRKTKPLALTWRPSLSAITESQE